MKKMIYGNYACEVNVASNYVLETNGTYQYEKDTVAYAVERFFCHCKRFLRDCTVESWKLRLAKGKARKNRKFQYLIPAVLMELPGEWVRIDGEITPVGVSVKKVEILKEHPYIK